MQKSNTLETPVQFIKGIGPKRAEALAEKGIQSVRDLLYYFPFDYVDLSNIEKIVDLRGSIESGKWITVIGTVRRFDLLGRPPRQRFVVILEDETGTVPLVFFRSVNYFKGSFKQGEKLAVSGKVTSFGSKIQIVHPSIDRLNAAADDDESDMGGFLHTKGLVPKYGSSGELKEVNLHVKGLRRVMRTVVDEYVDLLPEHLPMPLMARHTLMSLPLAIKEIHFPVSMEGMNESRRRLKFDELFSMQLLLAIRRQSIKVELPGISFNVESKVARQVVNSLPFQLTNSQIKVIKEITEDMRSGKPMNRLLQGDVGSGKTIVALVAMLIAIDNGYQVAFMAPTEILAEQHYQTFATLLAGVPINIRMLVGNQPAKLREDVLTDISRGSAQLIIGTHALIQENVNFARLGLAVVDEQHRFGVAQRSALKQKGASSTDQTPYPDVLVMTATPIPRTLSLTLYGDLDISSIDELPTNRKPIKTAIRVEGQRETVYKFLREEVAAGRQAYIVYPLVEVSEKLDLKAATEAFDHLAKDIFPDLKLGLIHGRMPSEVKDETMTAFKNRKIDILVATTVIEVGIDVPNASVMVIEHAERFGLSQLHQLRGRVGRGSEQSYCILIAPDWMGKKVKRAVASSGSANDDTDNQHAVRRLETMVKTTNGFKIAEIDLELRGPGDFFGTRQSGLPALQLANLVTDGDLLMLARREAFDIIDHDPHLRADEHRSLRTYFEERMKDALMFAEVG